MLNSKPVCSPISTGCKRSKDSEGESVNPTMFKQIIGSLMYLNATRPDVMFAVSLISIFLENPTSKHLVAVKRVLMYLRGTTEEGILYRKGRKQGLLGFCDSDYAGDLNDRKSSSGYVFMLNHGAVSWSSKK